MPNLCKKMSASGMPASCLTIYLIEYAKQDVEGHRFLIILILSRTARATQMLICEGPLVFLLEYNTLGVEPS